jgi:acetylornithine/N-succinyldiaminopimelate aminotransferase
MTATAHPFGTHADGLERCPFIPTYAPPAVMFERGLGTEVWDVDGKRYLDFLGGIAVLSLGHSHPDVAAAVATQAHTLQQVSNYFTNPITPQVAITLDRLLGGGGQVFFTNSGAEANECAIKLARRWGGGAHGRWQVVSAYGSFHGRTLATLHATGQPSKHEPFQPLPPGFRHVAWADIDALAAAVDDTVAAVLLETVQGEGGVNPMPPGYLAAVRALCDERGCLLIVDEVQTGLARTGAWFGFQHDLDDGVQPDIVTLAKALGNGAPVGACWAKAGVAAAFEAGDHGTTQGGNPLSAAAALATLRTMEAIDAPALARLAGATLRASLEALPQVVSVRGRGLLLAAELTDGIDAKAVYAECLAAGLIVNPITPTAIRLTPPLNVSEEHIDEAVAVLSGVLERFGSGVPAR